MIRASAQAIRLRPLAGAVVPTAGVPPGPHQPVCHLLEIDGLHILLDCGGTNDFSATVADAIAPYASKIDAVLISSAELSHCGSLPYLVPMLKADAPILATNPTVKLGLANVITQFNARFGVNDALLLGAAPVEAKGKKGAAAKKGTATNNEASQVFRPEAHSGRELTVGAIHAAFRRLQEVHYDQRVTLQSLQGTRSGGDGDAVGDGSVRVGGLGSIAEAAAAQDVAAEASASDAQDSQEGTHTLSMVGGIWSIDVKAMRAGRVTGSCNWRLTSQVDDIVYLHGGDMSLVDTEAVDKMTVPRGSNVLIMDCQAFLDESAPVAAAGPLMAIPPCFMPLPTSFEPLFDIVQRVCRHESSALIAVNVFTHGVTVLAALAKFFIREGLADMHSIVLACPKAHDLIERLKTSSEHLRWMPPSQGNVGEPGYEAAAGGAPIGMIVKAHTADDVRQVKRGGKCILAHTADLVDGLGAALFFDIAADTDGAVILTEVPEAGTPAALLLAAASDAAEQKKSEGTKKVAAKKKSAQHDVGVTAQFEFTHHQHEFLKGEELGRYLEAKAAAEHQVLLLDQARGGGDVITVEGGDASGSDADDDAPAAQAAPTVAEVSTPSHKHRTAAEIRAEERQRGMYLPAHHPSYASKSPFLLFPPTQLRVDGLTDPYGEALEDADLRRMQQRVGEELQRLNDGNAAVNQTGGGQQLSDATPAHVTVRSEHIAVVCSVHAFDLTGRTGAESLRHLLSRCFSDQRKVAFVNTTVDCAQRLSAYCKQEGVVRALQHVQTPMMGEAAFLETPIAAMEASVDSKLFSSIQAGLKTVTAGRGERGTRVSWEIGWVHGGMARALTVGKRGRESEPTWRLRLLEAPELPAGDDNNQGAAQQLRKAQQQKERSLLQSSAHTPGSIFVGKMVIPALGKTLRDQQMHVDAQEGAAVAIVNASAAVLLRTTGKSDDASLEEVAADVVPRRVLVETVAGYDSFSIRRAVYSQYGNVL